MTMANDHGRHYFLWAHSIQQAKSALVDYMVDHAHPRQSV